MENIAAHSDSVLVDLTAVSLVDLDLVADSVLAACVTRLRQELDAGLPVVAGFQSVVADFESVP